MKSLISIPLLFSILLFASCAMQQISFSEPEYHIKVYDSLSGSKDQLYLKANSWMIKAFNNAESVIQHSDKEGGVIIGKYLMSGRQSIGAGLYGTTTDNRVYAIIDIRVKDQKARIEIKPQGTWPYDPGGMTIYTYSKANAMADMQKLANSFHEALVKKEIEF